MKIIPAVIACLALAAPAAANPLTPFQIDNPDGSPAALFTQGAAEGSQYTTFWLPNGDIVNVRNITGGLPSEPDLDIGAGSTENPGSVNFNYDVGRTVRFYDGQKHIRMSITPRRTAFYDSAGHLTVTITDARVDFWVPVVLHSQARGR